MNMEADQDADAQRYGADDPAQISVPAHMTDCGNDPHALPPNYRYISVFCPRFGRNKVSKSNEFLVAVDADQTVCQGRPMVMNDRSGVLWECASDLAICATVCSFTGA